MIENALGSFVYQGRGEVSLSFGKKIPIVFKISHLKYAAEEFSTEIKVIDSTCDIYQLYSLVIKVVELKIFNASSENYATRIFSITGSQLTQDTLVLTHKAYDLGMILDNDLLERVTSSNDLEKLTLLVILTKLPLSPGLIPKEFYPDGTISFMDSAEKYPELNVEIGLGKATISTCYAYEGIKIDGNNAILQIEQPRILISIEPKLYNIPELFNQVENQLEDIIYLISLFSRCIIRQTQIGLYIPKSMGFTYSNPTRRYVKNKGMSRKKRMFSLDEFDDEEFQSILEQYRKEEHYETLKNAISFLLSSYEDSFLDTSYFLVHSALEAICKHQTKHIERRKMKDYKRVIYTIKKLKIEPQIIGLWIGTEHDKGMNIDFESGIEQAFSVRNELFHEAKIKDDLHFNLKTFRHILEIMVLTLLGIQKHP